MKKERAVLINIYTDSDGRNVSTAGENQKNERYLFESSYELPKCFNEDAVHVLGHLFSDIICGEYDAIILRHGSAVYELRFKQEDTPPPQANAYFRVSGKE